MGRAKLKDGLYEFIKGIPSSCKIFTNRIVYGLLSILCETKYGDHIVSKKGNRQLDEYVFRAKFKSNLHIKNVAIKFFYFGEDASLEYDLYSKFRKVFKNNPEVEIPKPITYFKTKFWMSDGGYFPQDILLTQCADCTPLKNILRTKRLYEQKFYRDILGKIIRITADVHNTLGTLLSRKEIKELEEDQQWYDSQSAESTESKFNLDLKNEAFRTITDFLNSNKKGEVWIKDIKPANWGYNFKTEKLVLLDFDCVQKHLPQWDWAKFIDNEELDGYDRKEILEKFLDYNSKSNEEKEMNRKLYYYCSFLKNSFYSTGFFDNWDDFDPKEDARIRNKKRRALHSLIRQRFQRALDSLEYIIDNYDNNPGLLEAKDLVKTGCSYRPL